MSNETRIADLIDLPRAVDMDSRFRDSLNESYDFHEVGGPFVYLDPAEVLEKCDNTAFRTYFNDWLDGEIGETVYEFRNEYYDIDSFRDCVQEAIDNLEAEASGVDDTDIPDTAITSDIELLTEFLDSI